jgi:hypothetical protein
MGGVNSQTMSKTIGLDSECAAHARMGRETMNDYATWRVGQRICRKEDRGEHGTVISTGVDKIKVKWDRGRTSYFQRDKPGNVMSI